MAARQLAVNLAGQDGRAFLEGLRQYASFAHAALAEMPAIVRHLQQEEARRHDQALREKVEADCLTSAAAQALRLGVWR